MIHVDKNNSSLKTKDFYINLIVCQCRRGVASTQLCLDVVPTKSSFGLRLTCDVHIKYQT